MLPRNECDHDPNSVATSSWCSTFLKWRCTVLCDSKTAVLPGDGEQAHYCHVSIFNLVRPSCDPLWTICFVDWSNLFTSAVFAYLEAPDVQLLLTIPLCCCFHSIQLSELQPIGLCIYENVMFSAPRALHMHECVPNVDNLYRSTYCTYMPSLLHLHVYCTYMSTAPTCLYTQLYWHVHDDIP